MPNNPVDNLIRRIDLSKLDRPTLEAELARVVEEKNQMLGKLQETEQALERASRNTDNLLRQIQSDEEHMSRLRTIINIDLKEYGRMNDRMQSRADDYRQMAQNYHEEAIALRRSLSSVARALDEVMRSANELHDNSDGGSAVDEAVFISRMKFAREARQDAARYGV